jgi:hypothetical protein
MKLLVAHELALAKFELRIEVSELVIWDLYKRGCFLPIFQTLPSSQTPHRHPASALFGRNTTTCPLALHLASSILSYTSLVLIAAQVASPYSSIPWLLGLLCHRIGPSNANSFALPHQASP